MKQVNLNNGNLGSGQPDLETVFSVCDKPEHLNQPIQSFPHLFSVTKKIAASAVR